MKLLILTLACILLLTTNARAITRILPNKRVLHKNFEHEYYREMCKRNNCRYNGMQTNEDDKTPLFILYWESSGLNVFSHIPVTDEIMQKDIQDQRIKFYGIDKASRIMVEEAGLEYIGIQYSLDNTPECILFNAPSGTTLGVVMDSTIIDVRESVKKSEARVLELDYNRIRTMLHEYDQTCGTLSRLERIMNVTYGDPHTVFFDTLCKLINNKALYMEALNMSFDDMNKYEMRKDYYIARLIYEIARCDEIKGTVIKYFKRKGIVMNTDSLRVTPFEYYVNDGVNSFKIFGRSA